MKAICIREPRGDHGLEGFQLNEVYSIDYWNNGPPKKGCKGGSDEVKIVYGTSFNDWYCMVTAIARKYFQLLSDPKEVEAVCIGEFIDGAFRWDPGNKCEASVYGPEYVVQIRGKRTCTIALDVFNDRFKIEKVLISTDAAKEIAGNQFIGELETLTDSIAKTLESRETLEIPFTGNPSGIKIKRGPPQPKGDLNVICGKIDRISKMKGTKLDMVGRWSNFDAMNRINELAKHEDDWDSYGSKACQEETVILAKKLTHHAPYKVDDIDVLPDGSIYLYTKINGKDMCVTIDFDE